MWPNQLGLRFGLDDNKIFLLERYLSLLHSVREINITAVKEKPKIVDVLFYESLILLDIPDLLEAGNAADVGSGAGIPGIPLAITRPDLYLTLIESNRKKACFILKAIRSLGLKNATVFEGRAEDAARSVMRDYFDVSVARAVAPLVATIEYSLPLVRSGGHAFLLRGKKKPEDIERAHQAAQVLNGSFERIAGTDPQNRAGALHVWSIKKDGPTPPRFPRKSGMAIKRPLA